MARPQLAHVVLRFRAPSGQRILTSARLAFLPTAEAGEWGVMADGMPIGCVYRNGSGWRADGCMHVRDTRLGAATDLLGAEAYWRHRRSSLDIAERDIMFHIRGEWWDVHRVREFIGAVERAPATQS